MVRLLFVCGGNTCRSPMAAALAADALPDAQVESAGILPGYALTASVIAVVREVTGRDPTGYKPRSVSAVDLEMFDRIITLDSMAATQLARDVPPGKLASWTDVRDPFGGSMDDYHACAHVIQAHLKELISD